MDNIIKRLKYVSNKFNINYQDKEDVIQQCLLFLYKKNIEEANNSYLTKLFKNTYLRYKKLDRGVQVSFVGLDSIDSLAFNSPVEDMIFENDIIKRISKLSMIPPKYRTAIVKYILDEESTFTVASELNIDKSKLDYYLQNYRKAIYDIVISDKLPKGSKYKATIGYITLPKLLTNPIKNMSDVVLIYKGVWKQFLEFKKGTSNLETSIFSFYKELPNVDMNFVNLYRINYNNTLTKVEIS